MPKRKQPVKKASKSVKPPEPVKKEVVKVGPKKKPTHSYSTYIRRLKNKFGEGVRLSSGFLQQTDRLTQVLARKLSSSAREICVANKKKTITDAEIRLAINLYFPTDMIDDTITAIQEAITKSAKAHKSEDGPQRREVIAGLVFPVSLTEKFLRQFGSFGWNVGKNAPIALTAALEHVVYQILDVSVEKSKEYKKATVYPRHMFLAIGSSNDGLSRLISNFKIEFMGVGVIPFIHPKLIVNKDKKIAQAARRRKGRSSDSGKRPHKFLPGTVALREIRRYQNGKEATKLLLQRLPFDRMIRQLAGEMGDKDIHFGAGSLMSIQHFTEQKVTDLIKASVSLALHAKREGVKASDVQMAWDLTYQWVPQTSTEAALDDTNTEEGEEEKPMKGTNGMVRLGRRGGAKRIGKDAFPVIRRFIHSLVSIMLSRTIEILRYRKVITVGLTDLETSVSTFGINFAILRPATKHRSDKKVGAK